MKTKYNWIRVPDFIKAIATNQNGFVVGFMTIPVIDEIDEQWVNPDESSQLPVILLGARDKDNSWKRSLEFRPNDIFKGFIDIILDYETLTTEQKIDLIERLSKELIASQ